MPTYYVSLSISRPPELADAPLIRLLHDAAEQAACVPIEVTPRGLIVEAVPTAVPMLETAMRAALAPRGAELTRITITEI